MKTPLAALLGCMLLLSVSATAQTAQIGADRKARGKQLLQIDSVQYRPAVWETEQVKEYEAEITNQGGLIYLYYTNVSEEAVHLRFWRLNGKDQSYWRLNHLIAWDRCSKMQLAPGESGVLEINTTQPEFKPGKAIDFYWVAQSGKPVAHFEGALKADPVRISFIRIGPELKRLEAHLRYEGEKPLTLGAPRIQGLQLAGHDWTLERLEGPGAAIASLTLETPLPRGQQIVLEIPIEEAGEARLVQTHRNAFPDHFPIGVWSAGPETYALLRRLHVDTFVGGGRKTDAFFQEVLPKYDFNVMVHTGVHTNVDMVRELSGHPRVACWMIQDEPDWSIPPNIMLHANEDVRRYDQSIPTFITLCRNIKFFEYAPICDIPCQDHYSVTAPSSSTWPKFYGTRLEETAWYTRDLKMASEPKPIWIWSQAIANWSERPKRIVPTPEELAAQLMLNLGRGAKGIIWFNYDHAVAERFPDARQAMGEWGRVLCMAREDFLACDPAALQVDAPAKVDVAPLLGKDQILLCITNLDYELHPEAYPFEKKTDITVKVALPAWIQPASVVELSPAGVTPLKTSLEGTALSIQLPALNACALLAVNNQVEAAADYAQRYAAALAEEERAF